MGWGAGLVRRGERGKGEDAEVVEVVVVTEAVSQADSSSSSSSLDQGDTIEVGGTNAERERGDCVGREWDMGVVEGKVCGS